MPSKWSAPISYAACLKSQATNAVSDSSGNVIGSWEWAQTNCGDLEIKGGRMLYENAIKPAPGRQTCLFRKSLMWSGGKAIEYGSAVADAAGADIESATGVNPNDYVPTVAGATGDPEARAAYQANLVKSQELHLKASNCLDTFTGILNNADILTKKDFDEFMSELQTPLKCMEDTLKEMQALQDEGEKAGGWAINRQDNEITPLVEDMSAKVNNAKMTVEIRLPARYVFDQKEPLDVLDSKVDIYLNLKKLEEECKAGFESLKLGSDGTTLTSEHRRKLEGFLCVKKCPTKFKTIEYDAEKWIDIATKNNINCKQNYMIIAVVVLIVALLMMLM